MNELMTQTEPGSGESAATAELRSILNDPTHRLHGPLMRGDADTNRYLDELYRKAYPDQTGSPVDAKPITQPVTMEDRLDQANYNDFLQRHFGETYDAVMTDMGHGVRSLFATPETVKAFDVFSEVITKLGPVAEIASIRFLSELGQLAKTQPR